MRQKLSFTFTLYLIIYLIWVFWGEYSRTWSTILYLNENFLVISLLIILSNIIKEARLKIFSYIVIAFKALLCWINLMFYLNFEINEFYTDILIVNYWLIALSFYLYASNKRIYQ